MHTIICVINTIKCAKDNLVKDNKNTIDVGHNIRSDRSLTFRMDYYYLLTLLVYIIYLFVYIVFEL